MTSLKKAQPMTHDAELTVTSRTAEATRSPAAQRMRRHRERRRDGLRCLTIELRETEMDALVHGIAQTRIA
jgi:hypothetical protein